MITSDCSLTSSLSEAYTTKERRNAMSTVSLYWEDNINSCPHSPRPSQIRVCKSAVCSVPFIVSSKFRFHKDASLINVGVFNQWSRYREFKFLSWFLQIFWDQNDPCNTGHESSNYTVIEWSGRLLISSPQLCLLRMRRGKPIPSSFGVLLFENFPRTNPTNSFNN